jgi:WD40 repeat protein
MSPYQNRIYRNSSGWRVPLSYSHAGEVSSVAFNPDGRTIASGSGGSAIKVWDALNGKVLRTLTGSGDGTLRIWCLATGKTIAVLMPVAQSEADYITCTADGYYDSSADASEYIVFHEGDSILDFHAYGKEWRRPDMVAKRLGR